MSADNTALADLRREIDAIDDALHDLIMRRFTLTGQIAASKATGSLALRPAREAQILRRLVARHEGALPRAIVVRLWREIISANTALQGSFAIAVVGRREDDKLALVAREHYGWLTPVQVYETASSVLRAVTDGTASVALLPLPSREDVEPWWRLIARAGKETPRIIARLPFAQPAVPEVEALAVSRAPNEATGQDRSFLVLEASGELSMSTIRRRLQAAGLEVLDIQNWGEGAHRLHLVEVEGFLAEDAPTLEDLVAEEIEQAFVVGGYAVPLSARELAPAKELVGEAS